MASVPRQETHVGTRLRRMLRSRRLLVVPVISVALAVALASCSASSDKPRVIGSDGASEPSPKASSSGETRPSSDESTQRRDLIVESGFTTKINSIGTRYTSVGVRLTNPNSDVAAYEVKVVLNLLGKDGSILETDTVDVPYVPAGGSLPVAPDSTFGFRPEERPQSMDVNVVGEFGEGEGPMGRLGDSVEFLTVDSAGIRPTETGPELAVLVSNPTDFVAEYADWACIFIRGGKIVGGASSVVEDPIVPGATVKIGRHLDVALHAARVDCQVSVSP